ncbi:hypothetical protein CAPTEDRAFT_184963 [Capitella teleta]|uniref:Apple domain-containing protein n=1 Tax=Capitella teleta TaxID=283909 RepID=R7UEJ9_CAPTE|nr:hypothetical protein CAPTEDRAFT_184963 [Capitella teleta]|eukprot:ELU04959.1 hypothetical protein CAPTEDRAFT_184963 [Capitella teleta]
MVVKLLCIILVPLTQGNNWIEVENGSEFNANYYKIHFALSMKSCQEFCEAESRSICCSVKLLTPACFLFHRLTRFTLDDAGIGIPYAGQVTGYTTMDRNVTVADMKILCVALLIHCWLNFELILGLSLVSSGLTSIPVGINPDVSELRLKDNKISTIHRSDFNDKYPRLYHVGLGENLLTSIETGCFRGTVLQTILLGYNKLTAFPDFREVKDTLETVSLKFNQVTKISQEDVNYLTKLTKLNLRNNSIVQLPELTMLLPSLLDLDLVGNELECCNSTAWLKRIPDALRLKSDNPPCIKPCEWKRIAWENVTEGMLLETPCEMQLPMWHHIGKRHVSHLISMRFTWIVQPLTILSSIEC